MPFYTQVWYPLFRFGTFGLLVNVATASNVSVSLPTVNDDARVANPDFCGFAFEQASFEEYALDADGNVNQFSVNLINSITSRTNGRPIIRLGGTSADYGRLEPGQFAPALPTAEQDNYQNIGNTTIGPSYWNLTNSFPDAQYIIQVPLATTNVTETIAWTQSAVDALGWDKIQAIEVGNEPDLYSGTFTGANGIALQPPGYQGKLNNETYVGNYTKYASAIAEAISLPEDPILQAFDVSTHFGAAVAQESYILDVETCFGLGIDADDRIKTVAHHYYQNNAGTASTLASGLMNMTTTHTHLDQFRRRIDWLAANKPDIAFVLSEVGNSLDATNSYKYQARLGSALWQADFYLYAMSIGVARINYQQIMHAGYNLWLPVASAGFEAQVFANFYSQPFVADFIGTSGEAKVQQLDIDGGETQTNLAAYGAFEGGALKRVAIMNLQYWNETSSGTHRPSTSIDLSVPGNVTQVTVDRLTSPAGAGAGADTITYAGSQWTYESLGLEVQGIRNNSSILDVTDGAVTISINDSEALLVSF
ncbi:beta-glucuronidase [Pestalotiopsis sp. NC0098]|nr:beta-glucuronidase [Pestalotiopsis sp. NC0098]